MIVREHPNHTSPGQILVARQAILDRSRQIFGYELLYRDTPTATSHDQRTNTFATARILCDALVAIGLDTLSDGRRAFINVNRQVLVDSIPTVLPPDRVVFELGADVTPDDDVLAACADLRARGYGLALNTYVSEDATLALLPHLDYVKVEFDHLADAQEPLDRVIAKSGRRIVRIAKKIETRAQFARAVALGYDYFQGFIFGQPMVKEGRTIPAQQLGRLRLVQALQDPSLSVDQIEALIKPDAALCYRTLRMANAAGLALRGHVSSIRDALLLLGRDPIRRWAALWAFTDSNRQASNELLALSAIRSRFCEMLAEEQPAGEDPAEAFLTGLCSLLDVILEQPMSAVLADLPIPEGARAALAGEANGYRRLLDCAAAYGSGEWDRAADLATAAGINPAVLPRIYTRSLRWVHAVRAESGNPE